ncbi:hypothetical protein K1719_003894 [Acacia pycnantha]|nr:hypothetical protein K1719_003894 [Acacia pycnantha]
MDQERRTTNDERKGNEIQENKDNHDQIQVARSATSQISEFKLFGVTIMLPAKDQISEEVVDQERSTSNNNIRDEIRKNKDHDQETQLSKEINQISRKMAKEEEEEPSAKRRTNKKEKDQ